MRRDLGQMSLADGLVNQRAGRNKWLGVSPIRSSVERGFATMKHHYRYRRVRDLGLVRNRCHLNLMCAAINLRRAIALAA